MKITGTCIDIQRSTTSTMQYVWHTNNSDYGDNGVVDNRKITLPKEVLKKTMDAVRQAGNGNMERFCLWLAPRSEGQNVSISELYIPEQYSSSSGGRVIISEDALEALNRYLFANRLMIVAQVHSHPEEAFHSWIDDTEYIATTEGSYSIVIPYFGRVRFSDINTFAFYILHDGDWMEMDSNEVRDAFEVK
jgi:proteasome lid subunit RPN8/RPN11